MEPIVNIDAAAPGEAEAATEQEGLYRRVGSMFHPSDLTMGPWRPDAQHGGPPSGLLTLLCEEQLEPGETVARVHVNLVASVPLEPLRSVSRRKQVSRRVAHVECELFHEDRKVAGATALTLTGGDIPAPDWSPPQPERLRWDQVDPSPAPHWAADRSTRPYHRDGVEHRFVEGRFDGAGPAVDWVRLKQPIVDGTGISGYQRAMAVVDLGSGISAAFDPARGFGMINADLNVAFVAEPVGPWLRLEAVSQISESGTGLAITRIFDQERLVALATQCLLGTSFKNA